MLAQSVLALSVHLILSALSKPLRLLNCHSSIIKHLLPTAFKSLKGIPALRYFGKKELYLSLLEHHTGSKPHGKIYLICTNCYTLEY